MKVIRLELRDFRNIHHAILDLGRGFNFLHGVNGAGKTAVLEAMHVLARGRSFRSPHLQDVIRSGQDRLLVRALLEDEHLGSQHLFFSRTRNGSTDLRVNGQPVRRMSQVAALLPMEVMTPDLVQLVVGGPSERRQWLDWGVFHVKHDFLGDLRRYNGAVRQRNACLRSISLGATTATALEPWNSEVARLGSHISSVRREHLEGLRPIISDCLAALGADFDVEIQYRQGWPDGVGLANVLGDSLSRELKSGATLAGPHRADVEFRTRGASCSAILSRGQTKILASSLLLAQADRIRLVAKRSGVFLVDDIGAELDEAHRRLFFQALASRDVQVFATAVDRPSLDLVGSDAPCRTFHVERGQIAVCA